jgi:hypothetical protein
LARRWYNGPYRRRAPLLRAAVLWQLIVADENAPSRREFCRKLCDMPHAERTLTHGSVVWLDNDAPDAVLPCLQTCDNEQTLTVVNLTGEPVNVRISVPRRNAFVWNTDSRAGRTPPV